MFEISKNVKLIKYIKFLTCRIKLYRFIDLDQIFL